MKVLCWYLCRYLRIRRLRALRLNTHINTQSYRYRNSASDWVRALELEVRPQALTHVNSTSAVLLHTVSLVNAIAIGNAHVWLHGKLWPAPRWPKTPSVIDLADTVLSGTALQYYVVREIPDSLSTFLTCLLLLGMEFPGCLCTQQIDRVSATCQGPCWCALTSTDLSLLCTPWTLSFDFCGNLYTFVTSILSLIWALVCSPFSREWFAYVRRACRLEI